ncbi:hypothetical protein ACLM5J_16550 [Nocardioides sp. Bht2]|uniref:hypothetical protein n=1 Tax=Nocardioides sp. Bht2 TaxID=3392297 RepID=UPI0039B37C2F
MSQVVPAKAPKRRKHLMDPNAPRPVVNRAAAEQSLTSVQRWVASSLAVTTILHLSGGLILAAMALPKPTLSAQIGLNVIAGAFGIIAVASWLFIHGRNLLSPWLLLGVIPGFVGVWLTLR